MAHRLPARLTPSEGRRFAFPVGAAFLVLAGITWWRGHVPVALGFTSISGLLMLAGLLVPGKLGPVYRAWMGLALVLSKVTTPIFMGITYFLVIAPTGIVMRVLGRNPMTRVNAGGSFWVSRPEPKRKSDLKRQF